MASADPDVLDFERTEEYSSKLAEYFEQLRVSGEFSNVTIRCNNETFHCHKSILAACSLVLKEKIRNAGTESSTQEVALHDIAPSVMHLLLKYMYKGKVDIPDDQLARTVEACHSLQLTELKEQCLTRAATVLKPSNIISWYKLACELKLHELKSKCLEILSTSLPETSKSSEFRQLSFAELSSYMSDIQKADVDCDDLVEAIMNWIGHKPNTRGHDMINLLQKVDLSDVSIQCIETVKENMKSLMNSEPAHNALWFLIDCAISIAKREAVRTATDRRHQSTLLVCGQVNDSTSHTDCWTFDPSTGFKELSTMPEWSPWHSVCGVPNGFAMTGGMTAPNDRLCIVFDLDTKSWKHLEALKSERYSHGSISMHGKLFLFGGMTIAGACLSSVHSMQLEGGKWTDEPDLPVAVQVPEVAIANDLIYLLDQYTSKQLWQLDVEMMTWCDKARFPEESIGARMVSVQGQLLVAGGREKVFGVYSPSTDTWCTGTTMPLLTHTSGALAQHGRRLYLMGGQFERRVEEYDLDTKAWTVTGMKVPEKLTWLHVVSIC